MLSLGAGGQRRWRPLPVAWSRADRASSGHLGVLHQLTLWSGDLAALSLAEHHRQGDLSGRNQFFSWFCKLEARDACASFESKAGGVRGQGEVFRAPLRSFAKIYSSYSRAVPSERLGPLVRSCPLGAELCQGQASSEDADAAAEPCPQQKTTAGPTVWATSQLLYVVPEDGQINAIGNLSTWKNLQQVQLTTVILAQAQNTFVFGGQRVTQGPEAGTGGL